MKRIAILAVVLPLAACNLASGMNGTVVEPSGTGTTRSFAVADFTGVSLRGSDDVEVRSGPFSVRAEGDSALLDRLEIRKDGATLNIGRKDGEWNWGGAKDAKIIVTLPRLTAASIAGAGDMYVDKAEGAFSGSIAGSGNLTVGQLRGDAASLSIAGSGDIRVAGGEAQKLDASIAGSGDIDATAFKAAHGSISIAGSGNVRAQVTGQASVSLVGSGDVELTGGAKCDVSKMGSGTARCS